MEKAQELAMKRAIDQSEVLFKDIHDYCAIAVSGAGIADVEKATSFLRRALAKCRVGAYVCSHARNNIGKGDTT